MKKYLMITLAGIILLASCKKETSNEKGGTTGVGIVSPKDSLLVKTVERGGTDSIVTLYGYDASRRLISRDYNEIISSSLYNEHIDLKRDASGIITKEIFKSDSLKSQGVDSILYNISYNASSGQYVTQVANVSTSNGQINDSTFYSYNAGGKIIQSEEFLNFGLGYLPVFKAQYAYDATGSISDTKFYTSDSSFVYQFTNENTYQYDLNVNPLKLSFESFLINDPTAFSSYNVVNALFTDELDATNTYGYNESYLYNTVNKPKTGTKTYDPSTGSTVSFYYQ